MTSDDITLTEEEVQLLIDKKYDLNTVDRIFRHIETLAKCGVTAVWIPNLNEIQLTLEKPCTRLYMKPWEFTAKAAIKGLVIYNIASAKGSL